MNSLEELGKKAKKAASPMNSASAEEKNKALAILAALLKEREKEILAANKKDIQEAKDLSPALIERLSLENRLDGIIRDIQTVIELPDPIGILYDEQVLPNNLKIAKSRTPIGVLGVIYESRPNVTIDVAALTIKSGNTAIMRGGSETLHTNKTLVEIIQEALEKAHLPREAIQFIDSKDRSEVLKLLKLHDFVDLIIPRGSQTLQKFCRDNSTIPVITGGIGICHLYVDKTADLERALKVVINAKTDRPTVCNALDTVLVNAAIAPEFIPKCIETMQKMNVTFKLDPKAEALFSSPACSPAGPHDWDTEWLNLTLGIKVVEDLKEAINHIQRHSSGHSDGILTEDKNHSAIFIKEIDSAAVYVNASTRFTDGGQFGLGSEVAISTQKIHARGPMGLHELTSYKWIVQGDYQIRK